MRRKLFAVAAALGLVAVCAGFGHYEPVECPDTTWAPTPETRPVPKATLITLDHYVIDDPPVRCYLACARCSTPAIHCVVVP